jgi:hypothetical protein
MRNHGSGSLRISVALCAFALFAGCGGAGGTAPTVRPGGAPLAVQPASIQFGTQATPPPQSVTVENVSSASDVTFSVQDPTVVGVTAGPPSSGEPTFLIHEIAHGATTVTFTANGTSASVSTQSFLCGRPDALKPAPVLLSPASGSTNVPAGVGTLYFGVYSTVPAIQPYLHLAVDAHGTLEGSALAVAALPAGTPTAPPQPGRTLTYMSATVPQLQPGTTYRTHVYDDGCQAALIAGSFST